MPTTTALYPNRLADKAKVEELLGFPEFPATPTPLYLPDGTLFAHTYTRIVYGDHGPYVELEQAQIACPLPRRWGKRGDPMPPDLYYLWLVAPNGAKVYYQLKTVADLPNAPRRADGLRASFNRKEGYADYRVGLLYISPYDLKARV